MDSVFTASVAYRHFRTTAAVAIVLAVLLSARSPPPHAQGGASELPCNIITTERVVAVGDVHGAYDRFVGILRAAGLIDGRQRWVGGRAHLVQTGDVLDRGADPWKVVDLLRRLECDAASAGARVHALLGNHEFMRVIGDWPTSAPENSTRFRTSRARGETRLQRARLPEQFNKDHPSAISICSSPSAKTATTGNGSAAVSPPSG